jgi:hypothetical protein
MMVGTESQPMGLRSFATRQAPNGKMKPLPGNHQLGLASPLKYAAIKSGENQKPSTKGSGLMQASSRSPEGKGKDFFLDILFYRMSESLNCDGQ